MSNRDNFLELAWENGQILFRGLSSTQTEKSTYNPCKTRIQCEGDQTSTTNTSNNEMPDSTFADPLSGLSLTSKLKNFHDQNKINSLQTGYSELFSSEMYEDGFNVVPEADKTCKDKQHIDSNGVVPVNKFKRFNERYLSMLVPEIEPQLQTENSNSEVPQFSMKEYDQASIQFMRSKEKKSGMDEKSERRNFSIFLRALSPGYVKSKHPSCGATGSPTKSPAAVGSEDLEGKARSDPRINKTFEKEANFMDRNMKLPDSEPQKEIFPDEQSQAVGYKDIPPNAIKFPTNVHGGPSSSLAPPNTAKENPGNIKSVAPPNTAKENPGNIKSVELMVASSSVCSRGASNCPPPTYTLERRSDHEDTDLDENHAMDHEAKGATKAAAARRSKGAKRKRKAEVHNLSERKRRDKINKKMRALQELIPNCNKLDKATILDEAIEYLKTLQLQVQMMSMGTGVYMPPNPMNLMLPLDCYSPMAMMMGIMRMQMGLGCINPAAAPQFPTSLMSNGSASAATLPGITEAGAAAAAGLNMLGFPSQALLMSMSPSPFVSLGGRLSPQSVQAPGTAVPAAAAAQVELPVPSGAVPLSTSKGSNPSAHY